MASKQKSLLDMTDDEIAAYQADLADQKRAIKARENEARYVAEARRALAGLSDEARRIVTIKVGGQMGPAGGSAQEVTH